jgi:hypothetical protein
VSLAGSELLSERSASVITRGIARRSCVGQRARLQAATSGGDELIAKAITFFLVGTLRVIGMDERSRRDPWCGRKRRTDRWRGWLRWRLVLCRTRWRQGGAFARRRQ